VNLPISPSEGISLLSKLADLIGRLFKRKGRFVIEPTTNVVLGRFNTWWSTAFGTEPGMQIVGDFYLSNNTDKPRFLTRIELVQWYPTYGAIPRRRKLLGMITVQEPGSNMHGHYPILAHAHSEGRATWFTSPPFVAPGQVFRAKVCVVDSTGEKHWTRKLRWYDISRR